MDRRRVARQPRQQNRLLAGGVAPDDVDRPQRGGGAGVGAHARDRKHACHRLGASALPFDARLQLGARQRRSRIRGAIEVDHQQQAADPDGFARVDLELLRRTQPAIEHVRAVGAAELLDLDVAVPSTRRRACRRDALVSGRLTSASSPRR
jgi:hypothetical protein